jgi:hypothetical protein
MYVYFKDICLCGVETWASTNREENKLRGAEMEFLGAAGKSQQR